VTGSEVGVQSILDVIEEDNWLWEPGENIVVPLGRPRRSPADEAQDRDR
jgi:hypothetical protein